MNKKGNLEVMVDTAAAIILLIITVMIISLTFTAPENETYIRYRGDMNLLKADEALTHFLKGSSSETPVIDLIWNADTGKEKQALKNLIKERFTAQYGEAPWRLVITYPDGHEIDVDEATGPSSTAAETYLPSPEGPIHVYLQTGNIKDYLIETYVSNPLLWFLRL